MVRNNVYLINPLCHKQFRNRIVYLNFTVNSYPLSFTYGSNDQIQKIWIPLGSPGTLRRSSRVDPLHLPVIYFSISEEYPRKNQFLDFTWDSVIHSDSLWLLVIYWYMVSLQIIRIRDTLWVKYKCIRFLSCYNGKMSVLLVSSFYNLLSRF